MSSPDRRIAIYGALSAPFIAFSAACGVDNPKPQITHPTPISGDVQGALLNPTEGALLYKSQTPRPTLSSSTRESFDPNPNTTATSSQLNCVNPNSPTFDSNPVSFAEPDATGIIKLTDGSPINVNTSIDNLINPDEAGQYVIDLWKQRVGEPTSSVFFKKIKEIKKFKENNPNDKRVINLVNEAVCIVHYNQEPITGNFMTILRSYVYAIDPNYLGNNYTFYSWKH